MNQCCPAKMKKFISPYQAHISRIIQVKKILLSIAKECIPVFYNHDCLNNTKLS